MPQSTNCPKFQGTIFKDNNPGSSDDEIPAAIGPSQGLKRKYGMLSLENGLAVPGSEAKASSEPTHAPETENAVKSSAIDKSEVESPAVNSSEVQSPVANVSNPVYAAIRAPKGEIRVASPPPAYESDEFLAHPVVSDLVARSEGSVTPDPENVENVTREESIVDARDVDAGDELASPEPKPKRRRRSAAQMLEAATELYLSQQPLQTDEQYLAQQRAKEAVFAPAVKPAAPTQKRGPGRPPKNGTPAKKSATSKAAPTTKKTPSEAAATPVKRGRGRPPKNVSNPAAKVDKPVVAAKRGRGRPKKS